jgi:hypothetical protein
LYRRLGQNYLNKESETIFVKRSFRKDFRIIFLEEKIGFKRNYLKKDRGKVAVRLGRRIRKNGSRRWVGAGRRYEMKNKIIKYICRLTTEKLTKRAKGLYKNVSNVQNLIFK